MKAVIVFLIIFSLLLAVIVGLSAEKAGARASQVAYMTAGPNTWEMMGFNVTGTAAKFIVDYQGWNVSRTFGNVGIGDGSVRALNMSSNVNGINYTDKNYMAGDIASAPWDPTRIKDFSMPEREAPEHEETADENTMKTVEAGQETQDIVSEHIESGQNEELASKGGQEVNETAGAAHVEVGGNTALRDPFHTMLFGRPVGDLLYEHPHGISANMYSRLVGLQVPGGSVANIGMRAIGYGY